MPRTAIHLIDKPPRGLMATGVWVVGCGHHVFDAAYQFAAPGRPDYLLILTLAGEGWLRLGRRSYAVGAGEAFVVPPDRDYAYGTGSSGTWEVLWMDVAGPTVAPLLAFWPDFAADPCARIAEGEEMTRLLAAVLRELAEGRDGYRLLAAGYADQALRQLVVDARHGRANKEPSHVRSLVQTVEAYVRDHLDTPLTLADMAVQAHVSPSYLCKAFRKTIGFSPLEYSIKQRLNRAKTLLSTTVLPVATIARQVGYDDAAYFARVFRTTTGLSPTAFRRQELATAQELKGTEE